MRCRLLLALLTVLGLLGACAAPPAPTAAPPAAATAAPDRPTATAGFPLTIKDDAGRQVTIARPPQRIVSIAPSNTEILFALGLGDRVVAVDQYSNFPPEAKQKAQLGSYVKPNLEALVAATPDLVLATEVHTKSVLPELEGRNLTAVVVDPKNVDEVFDRILLVGKVTGQDARAEKLVGELKERTASVTAKVKDAPKTRVFLELSPELHTAGPGTFVHDLIERSAGQNVAADAGQPWPQLSLEALVQRDPEVILLADEVAGETPEKVKARPAWDKVSAVKAGRVVVIDPDLASRPGPRIVDGLELVARALHPDRFR
ncbi:MAG TPA: cobalamin-binding protein [Chloroflexota bacterium]|nr:cobalamin-binding protein [Chloroflexota bacterium]